SSQRAPDTNFGRGRRIGAGLEWCKSSRRRAFDDWYASCLRQRRSGRCLLPLSGPPPIALRGLSFNLRDFATEKIGDLFYAAAPIESAIQAKQLVFGPRLQSDTISPHRAAPHYCVVPE